MLAKRIQPFKKACSQRTITPRAVKAGREAPSVSQQIAPAVLAAFLLGAPTLPLLQPHAVHADEEIDESRLSPFERRQLQNQRRRELLQKTREQAESKSEASSTPVEAAAEPEAPAAPAPAPKLSTDLRSRALNSYEAAAKSNASRFGGLAERAAPEPAAALSAEDNAPPAVTAPEVKMPGFSMPKFERPSVPAPAPPAPPAPAAVPAPPPPPPPPAPKPAQAAVVTSPAPAPAPAPTPSKKRQGPLPLWLAEVVVLAGFAGVVAGSTVYAKDAAELGQAVSGLAKKATDALPKP